MEKKYQVPTPQDFSLVIKDIFLRQKEHKGNRANNNIVLALQGDLGAGKTTFTQELGRFLGVAETVNSPTFVIMKQYEINYEDFDRLVHIDAYRLEDESEALPLRLKEIINRPHTIVCIEWPELISSLIPEQALGVKITIGDGEVRTVRLESSSR